MYLYITPFRFLPPMLLIHHLIDLTFPILFIISPPFLGRRRIVGIFSSYPNTTTDISRRALIEEEQPLLPKTEQQSVGNKKDLDQYIPLLLIAIFVWAFFTFIFSNGQIQSLRGIRRDTTELHKVVKDLVWEVSQLRKALEKGRGTDC